MNVLMNCISAVSGGGRAHLRNISSPLLAEFVAEEKNKLFFLAYADQLDLLNGIPKPNIIPVERPRLSATQRFMWERLRLPIIAASKNIDVIFTPYQVGVCLTGIKNVLMIRNMEPFYFDSYNYSLNTWLRNTILSAASRYCLRQADRVIAVSKFAANELEKIGIQSEKVIVAYHGSPAFSVSDHNESQKLAQLGITGSFMLTCGSMLPYRRYEDVILSFERSSCALRSDTILVIAGSGADLGYKKTLLELVSASPHRDRILVLGEVPWRDMGLLYRNCVCCVIASEIEACPNIALEAMTAGACIIASDRPPLPEIFDGCAVIFEPRNVSVLAKCLDEVFYNGDMRNRYRALASKRALAFSWAQTARKTYCALTHW